MPRTARLTAMALAVAAAAALVAAPVLAAGLDEALPGDTINYFANPELASLPMQGFRSTDGPTLLLSDAPETVPGPGILYQDDVNGPFRVFFDHVNGSADGGTLVFTVLATNAGTAPATVTLTRVGYAGPSTAYFLTGQAAQSAWMASAENVQVTLAPGETAFLLPQLNGLVASAQQDVTGIIDGSSDASVQLSVVAEAAPAASLTGLSVLPAATDPTGFALRGTFPHAEITVAAQADGAFQHLDMAVPTDYLRGYSAVDGMAPAEDYGNYGVLYDVRVMTMGNAGTLAAVFDPLGGPFAGTALVGTGFGPGAPVDLPAGGTYAPDPLSSILLGHFTLQQDVPVLLHVEWMPPSGSNLPVSLVLSAE